MDQEELITDMPTMQEQVPILTMDTTDTSTTASETSGSPLMDYLYQPAVSGDYVWEQVEILVIATIVWAILTLGLRSRFLRKNKVYTEMKSRSKKGLYLSWVISLIHAVFAFIVALLGVFTFCGPPPSQIQSDLDEDVDYGQNIFVNNGECLQYPKRFHQVVTLISNAYLIVDFYIIAGIVGGKKPYHIQVYAHHIVMFLSQWATLAWCDFPLGQGVAMLIVEFSTIFTNLRMFFKEHHYPDSWNVNASILLFISFFFVRLCFTTWQIYWLSPYWIFTVYLKQTSWSTWGIILLTFMQVACVLAWFLNLYWFKKMYLILKSYMKDGDVEAADKFTTSANEDQALKNKGSKGEQITEKLLNIQSLDEHEQAGPNDDNILLQLGDSDDDFEPDF